MKIKKKDACLVIIYCGGFILALYVMFIPCIYGGIVDIVKQVFSDHSIRILIIGRGLVRIILGFPLAVYIFWIFANLGGYIDTEY